MGSLTDIFGKLLERAPLLLPAGALTVLTMFVAPASWGLTNVEPKLTWFWLFGIFCGWATVVMIVTKYAAPTAIAAHKRFRKARMRREAVAKLDVLTPQQDMYLSYIKKQGSCQFQAWTLDDTIEALVNMGILEQHERTDRNFARYVVNALVWPKLPEPTEEQLGFIKKRFGQLPPWDPSHRSSRI